MAQKLKTKLSLIEWCDQQVAEGKELSIHWEGGGDSGWVYFQIDGKQIADSEENSQIRELIDLMYDTLDYGSWAGEFTADGQAVYNPTEKAFVGTDYYGEDETDYHTCEIKISIPKDLWFDAVEYNIEGEEAVVEIAFIIRNGFLTDKHEAEAKRIMEELSDAVDAEISKYTSNPDSMDYQNVWQNIRIQRSEFIEEGDMLVYTIEELNMGVRTTEEKDVYLKLTTEEDEEE